MTINAMLQLVDGQKPNGYDDRTKIHWLDQLDRMAFREVIATHEDGVETFDGYDEDTDGNTELLIPDDFSQVYVYWLYAMIDFANQEMSRYTNSMIMFNTAYGDYQSAWNRTHMPLGERIRGAEWRVRR